MKYIICLCLIASTAHAQPFIYMDLTNRIECRIEALQEESLVAESKGLFGKMIYLDGKIDAYNSVIEMISTDLDIGPWDW